MNLLLKSATISFPGSEFHNKQTNILISNGTISEIGDNLSNENTETIDCKGAILSPGWVDMQANFADPGKEQKEEIETGIEAAAYGGFTNVVLSVETDPPIQSKSSIEYIKSKTRGLIVNVLPMAAISKELKGDFLSEMIDLHRSGAIAFSDGNKGIVNGSLVIKSLIYAHNFNGLIVLHPDDPTISSGGVINEGIVSTALGLKGSPVLSETLSVTRAISLCEYTGGRLHLSQISSAESVELVRKAKKDKLPITASTTIHHLIHTEEDLRDFNTNLKFKLPLRTETDRQALLNGIVDGTIDAVISDHSPHENDRKKCEFELAANGAIGIQLMLPLLLKAMPKPDLELISKVFSLNPRKILNLEINEFKKGAKADFTIYSPDLEWEFNKSTNKSRSQNNIHFGTKLKGHPIAIINNGSHKILHY